MADLRLVTVQPDGSAGSERGRLRLDGDTIVAEGGPAQGLLDTLHRHFRRSDTELWRLLQRDGWSNGHLMIAP